MAIFRLIHIANHSPALAPAALQSAIQSILETSNTTLYISTVQDYNALPSTRHAIPVDQSWLEEVSARNASEKNRLEVELKQYTSNMIKESIRVSPYPRLQGTCNSTLDRWGIAIWATFTALQVTITRRSRATPNHASSAQQVSTLLTCAHPFFRYDMVAVVCPGIPLIVAVQLLIEQRYYAHIGTYVFKAEAALDAAGSKNETGAKSAVMNPACVRTRQDFSIALGHLGQGNYSKAAYGFLKLGHAVALGGWLGTVRYTYTMMTGYRLVFPLALACSPRRHCDLWYTMCIGMSATFSDAGQPVR
jgi:COP9 signalosome complex subunit 1